MEHVRPLKIVIIGDSFVGRTTILTSYNREEFPIVDIHQCNVVVDAKDYHLILWDAMGHHDFERLRRLIYRKTDCFILCYSIGSRTSFKNIKNKWLPEIHDFLKKTPVVLVGNKLDLRDHDSEKFVTQDEGLLLRDEIRAHSFVECSALKKSNLSAVFENVVHAIAQARPRKEKCNIL